VRAAIFNGPRNITPGDRPDAAIGEPSDATVRVVLACVCGSDLLYYRGETPFERRHVALVLRSAPRADRRTWKRWPDPWPTDYLTAMRAATYSFTIGKGREFTLQAFRNAFRHGCDMSIAANVLGAVSGSESTVIDLSPLPATR